jgi:N-acetylglucosamine-6-phosphate deacetylase
VAGALVDGSFVAGDVTVDREGRLLAVGARPAARSGLAVPGFVDLQVNGFGGVDLAVADRAGYSEAATALARHGVTSYLPTLPTAAPEEYGPALPVAASVVAGGADAPRSAARRGGGGRPVGACALGVLLEGPFLARPRAGAHRPEHLRSPDVDLLARFLAAAPVTMMTLAPELPGGSGLVARLTAAGVVVALGHSDATAAEARAAFDAGATAVTHLWNAMRPVTAREPGLVGAALAHPAVRVCVIADLVHVAPETLRLTWAAARGRVVVVSDAVSPAGLGDGEHCFGGRPVTSRAGVVRLADGTLAGSACPLDAALRNLVALGIPVEEAVTAVSTEPARLLGRADVGSLTAGRPADVVVLDDSLAIRSVLVAGEAADV